MVRKLITTFLLTLAGLIAFASSAVAAPPYPAPPVVIVNVNVTIIIVNGSVVLSGSGFDPNEGIGITTTYGPPSGLRHTAALAQRGSDQTASTTADANGNVSTEVTLTQVGTATETATGLTSGKVASITVDVRPVGSSLEGSSSTSAIAGAGSGSASQGSESAASLASTGANVMAPIAVGVVALVLGLGLLLLGTRGVIRRKNAVENK